MAKSGKKVSKVSAPRASAKKVAPKKGRQAPENPTLRKPIPQKVTPPKGTAKKQAKRPAWGGDKPTKPVSGGEILGHSKRRGAKPASRTKADTAVDKMSDLDDLTVAPGKPQKQNVRRVRPDNPTTDENADNQPDEARSVMQGGSDVNDDDKVQTDEADPELSDDDRTSLDDVEEAGETAPTDDNNFADMSDDDDDDDDMD